MICAHNYVRTFDFILRIWNRPHDKDCLYILSSSKNSLLSHFNFQWQHPLSVTFWLTETGNSLSLSLSLSLSHTHTHTHTHTLIYWGSTLSLSSFRLPETAWPCQLIRHSSIRVTWVRIHSATFFFPVLPFWLDLFQPRTQPQKFRQTPKETNNQHGRRHVPPRIHCYISVYWYLAWNT